MACEKNEIHERHRNNMETELEQQRNAHDKAIEDEKAAAAEAKQQAEEEFLLQTKELNEAFERSKQEMDESHAKILADAETAFQNEREGWGKDKENLIEGFWKNIWNLNTTFRLPTA